MLQDKIDVLTQSLRAEFVAGYDAVPEPPPIEAAMTRIGSKGRVENYSWLDPVPGIAEWQGYRRYGRISDILYRVPNATYDGAFEILVEDLEDDQTGGYALKAKDLGEAAKVYPCIKSLQNLAAGQSVKCFDDSNFFSASHNIGLYPTGGNIVTGTAAGSDGVTHAMVALVINRTVKPLIWQERAGPDFKTDAGSIESSKVRSVKAWVDLRGAPAFGYWWDAVLVKFSNTPTVQEMQTTLGNLSTRFRQFKLPKNLTSDPDQYVHGQTDFNDKSLMIVNSTGIEQVLRQALTLSLIAQTENFYKGMAKQVTAGYLDGVV